METAASEHANGASVAKQQVRERPPTLFQSGEVSS
jgi:hypothetical protein